MVLDSEIALMLRAAAVRKLGINYKLSTNLEVDIKAWQKAQDRAQSLQKFQAKKPKL